MGKQTFIEVNGKKYDAATGKMLSGQQSNVAQRQKVSLQTGVGAVDGFARPKQKPHTSRAAAAHAKKAPQKSTTLMRNSVKKPDTPTPNIKNATPTIAKSSLGASHRRTKAALQTPKSPHVQKFDHPAHRPTVTKKSVAITPKPMPSTHADHPASAAGTMKNETSRQASARMIDQALANSTAHDQSSSNNYAKKRSSKLRKKLGISRKVASLGTGALAAVLLAGFFAVNNVPNLSMRVAATRAGFEASMPGYQPSGFSFRGPINYNAGIVTVSFASNTDDRTYSLTQRSSNWTSDALLANFIESENLQYQTFLDKGRTLYIYEGSNATWVDNGIWYQVEGDSDLSTDQLVRIASSL